jgi:hypothetical protein
MEMPQLIVTQQALLRYYGNAIKDLTCHNMYFHTMQQNICLHVNASQVFATEQKYALILFLYAAFHTF